MKKNITDLELKANWKNTLFFFLFMLVFSTLLITQFFGTIKLNNTAVMDFRTYYDSGTFFSNIEEQGDSGRKGYLILHLFDYGYMVFSCLFWGAFILILSRATSIHNFSKYAVFFPVFSFLFDFFENISIDLSLILYPKSILALGIITGYFSFLKFCMVYATFGSVLVLLVFNLIRILKTEKDKKKFS